MNEIIYHIDDEEPDCSYVELKTPCVIATVGISGSGKSTWTKQFMETHKDWKVICPDQIRKDLTGNISDQSKNHEVWNLAYERLDKYTCEQKNILFDSTCTNLDTVKRLLRNTENQGIPIYFKIFECNPNTANCRVNADILNGVERSNVPREVIERQYEGFKKVVKWLKDNKKSILTL